MASAESASSPKLLLEALAYWVEKQPDKVLFNYLKDDGTPLASMTYAAVELKSRALAAHLVAPAGGSGGGLGCAKGDRVLLVFEPSLTYIVAFIACVRAGLVAVPVFPPDPRKLKKDMFMFATIAGDCGAKIALTSTTYDSATKMAALKHLFSNDAKWPVLTWCAVDTLPAIVQADKALKLRVPGSAVPAVASTPVAASDLAFLQYTSGSTSEPKGVMISHANLAHNLACIIDELGASTETVVVSWLPQYHDMGLIGSYLGVIYCGGSGFYLSPFAFLKNPLVWLQAISEHRGTHMQAPNFGYALATRRYKALQKPLSPPLDLSCVKHMINAAEPVDVQDLEAFERTFGTEAKLPPKVVFPTYGLAEHTVFVSSGGGEKLRVDKRALEVEGKVVIAPPDAPADQVTVTVGCGHPARPRPKGVAPVKVVIAIDPKTVQELKGKSAGDGKSEPPQQRSPSPGPGETNKSSGSSSGGSSSGVVDEVEALVPGGEDVVGEVWVTSPSKANGYWGNPAKTKEDFQATFSSDGSAGARSKGGQEEQKGGEAKREEAKEEFLRTGDQGFLHNGEVFICGRLKDLIIVRGRNHYPQDLERCVEASGGNLLRAGRSAAFSVNSPLSTGESEEAVAVVAELRNPLPSSECATLCSKIKQACWQEQGVQPVAVLLCKDRTVPITTSGKIARRWCKRAYDQGTFQVVYEWRADPNTANGSDANGGGGGGGAAKGGRGSGGGGGEGDDEEDDERVAAVDVEGWSDDELLASLIQDVQQATNLDEADFNPDAALVDLGVDSLGLAQVAELLRRKYQCPVPDQWLYFDTTTTRQLLVAVRNGGVSDEEAANGTMLELKETGGKNALVDTCPCLLMCCPQFVLGHGN